MTQSTNQFSNLDMDFCQICRTVLSSLISTQLNCLWLIQTWLHPWIDLDFDNFQHRTVNADYRWHSSIQFQRWIEVLQLVNHNQKIWNEPTETLEVKTNYYYSQWKKGGHTFIFAHVLHMRMEINRLHFTNIVFQYVIRYIDESKTKESNTFLFVSFWVWIDADLYSKVYPRLLTNIKNCKYANASIGKRTSSLCENFRCYGGVWVCVHFTM